jgi:uncharacterized protein
LQWLAPYKGTGVEVLDAASLRAQLAELPQPVLVAVVKQIDGWEVEQSRGFIVPEDWTAQAAVRRMAGTLPV